MPPTNPASHDHAIIDQFTRQAHNFATAPELHNDAVLDLIVTAARPNPNDHAIDLACGPGSVACDLARHTARVIGLDATEAMLAQARTLATAQNLSNLEFVSGSVYHTPYEPASFDIVTCRFAFHHFEDPQKAFAEMLRLAKPGGRIVLCDGLASADPKKAAAFNAMEKFRDPSTVVFRTLDVLRNLFHEAALSEPDIKTFQIPDLVAASLPKNNDRAGLADLITSSVDGDPLGMNASHTPEGIRINYRQSSAP